MVLPVYSSTVFTSSEGNKHKRIQENGIYTGCGTGGERKSVIGKLWLVTRARAALPINTIGSLSAKTPLSTWLLHPTSFFSPHSLPFNCLRNQNIMSQSKCGSTAPFSSFESCAIARPIWHREEKLVRVNRRNADQKVQSIWANGGKSKCRPP